MKIYNFGPWLLRSLVTSVLTPETVLVVVGL